MDLVVTDLAGVTHTLVTSGGPVAGLLIGVATDGADHATVIAGDGYRASIPLPALVEGGMLRAEGGRLRLRVEQGATLCWNVKDVVAIEVTVGPMPDDVPDRPTH